MESTISLPFRFYSGGVEASYTKAETWKNRVFIALTTGLTERVMRPDYGTEINLSVFENPDMATDMIKRSVHTTFGTWLPSLTLDSVLLEPDQADGSLNIRVNYTLPNAQKDTLVFKTATFNRYGEIVRGIA